MLEKLGYRAHVVGSGSEAVRALSNTRYGAVLMDCHMPQMNGYEATVEIRKQEEASGRTPIIAMTASVMSDDREKCLAAGMDDYVSKPVQLEELRLALKRWVGNESPRLGAAAASGGHRSANAAIDAGRLAELRTLDPPDGPTTLSVLASILLGETPQKLTSLRGAVLEGNTDTVEDVAHYLKGAAANIGATRMAALCAELENLARSGATPAPHLLTRLDAEFAHAREELEAQLAQE